MRAKLDGFTTRAGLHWLVDRLWDSFGPDIAIMTGINMYCTPRTRSGAEITLVDDNGEEIKTLPFSMEQTVAVPLRKKPKKPKLVSIAGGKE